MKFVFFSVGKKLRTPILVILACICVAAAAVFIFAQVKNVAVSAPNEKTDKKVIMIDPGHGGVDGGAVGYNNIVEKNINLAISLKLRTLFEASGFTVVMTREDDRSIHDAGSDTIREKKVTDIHNRSKLLAQYPGAVFISVHQNKFQQSQYSGTQVFYSVNNAGGKVLASCIQSDVKKLLQNSNNRVIKPAGDNLYILYHAQSPAVMVECGFLSNPREAVMLTQSQYQMQMAFSIYCGTLDYYLKSETEV